MMCLKIACLNPVQHYGLDVGTLHIGDPADFIEVKDLKMFHLMQTVIGGNVVAKEAVSFIDRIEVQTPNKFKTGLKKEEDFALSRCKHTKVIHAIDHTLITEEEIFDLSSEKVEDILKIAVVNRYENKEVAIAFIHGFGLKKGAIASSVAHDSTQYHCGWM